MRCTKCGAEIGDNEKFCSVCGTPVNGDVKTVDDTLSDNKADKKGGSEKQNSNTEVKSKVNDDTLTDTQSDIVVSDVTVEEITLPDETISEDSLVSDDTISDDTLGGESKKKSKAKEPDEISDEKDKKKSKVKEEKEEKPAKEPKAKKVKEDKSDKKSDDKDKSDVKSEQKADKADDKKAADGKDSDKKEPEDKKEEVKAEEKAEDKSKVEEKPADNKATSSLGEPKSEEVVTEVTINDKVIKLDNDSKDIQLTVTETTTVSEQLFNSNDTINDYEVKMPENNEKKQISVAGKNLTFVEGNKFSLARDDKLLSPGARANIERRKAEAAEALKKGKSDEERINEAVKAIKESLLRNGKEGWICRVCGHYNPSTTTSCLKCGRDRVRMAKLKARGYDPNAVPQLVKRKRRVRPKKERIVYLPSDKKAEVESGAPVVHNFIYTGQQVVVNKDQYVTVEHPLRNRILAAVCTLLMLLFIFVSLFATSYISTDGSFVKGFTGIEIISSVLVSIFGGTKTGSKYFDMFSKEVATNGWVFTEAGFMNQRTFAGLFVMLLLLAVVGIAIADLIRCIIRIVKGKALNGKFHILAMLILVGVCVMFYFIWIHNTFAFYKEGASAFWGHAATATVTLEGMTITDAVYATGIAYILTFFFILARFIIGFFFAKPQRMTLSEACEKYPNQYPKKYQEQASMTPEEYEVIMRNAGVQPVATETTVKRTTTTETVSTFDQPVVFTAPPPPPPTATSTTTTTTTTSTVAPVVTVAAPAPAPAPEPVKETKPIPPPEAPNTQTFTTYTVTEKKEGPIISEYTVTTPPNAVNTIDSTQDLDNGREKSKKEGK